jgi:hypothetical protein
MSPRAWQAAVDADVEDEVVEIFLSELSTQSGDTTDTHARTSIMLDLLFIWIAFTQSSSSY